VSDFFIFRPEPRWGSLQHPFRPQECSLKTNSSLRLWDTCSLTAH